MVQPSPQDTQDSNAALKAEAKALMAQRDALEQQLGAATARLETSGAGLHGSLVDNEGFPRGDAFEIRNDRQAVSRLTNDIRSVNDEIEQHLHKLHAAARAAAS